MDKAKWIERFAGHFYLDIMTRGYDVHVCARGMNVHNPVAIVSLEHGGAIFFKTCPTLEEAKKEAEDAYRNILTQALEELGG